VVFTMSQIDDRPLCSRYADLYTGAVTDSLDELGYQDQTLDPEIRPLDETLSMAGVAFPITGRPNRSIEPEENIRTILTMLSEAPEESVLVYDTSDDVAAHIGELTTTSLRANDCRGAVIDGGARDTSFIREQEFPVFRRYDTPADCVYRWELLDWGVKTTVGGVSVEPGDVVVGDADGVVVVPNEVRDEVLVRAEARANSEDAVREAVENGVSPIDAYDEYGAF
jgi:regulator of RNase E activity RraA